MNLSRAELNLKISNACVCEAREIVSSLNDCGAIDEARNLERWSNKERKDGNLPVLAGFDDHKVWACLAIEGKNGFTVYDITPDHLSFAYVHAISPFCGIPVHLMQCFTFTFEDS